jgi:hypothetical protein
MQPDAVEKILLVLVGAAVGVVPTFVLERARRSHELSTRWDQRLLDAGAQLASAARRLQATAQRRLDGADEYAPPSVDRESESHLLVQLNDDVRV